MFSKINSINGEFNPLYFFLDNAIYYSYQSVRCEISEPTGMGIVLLMMVFGPILTIFSTIAFIYMAKFKGKMILIFALLFLILGFIPNILMSGMIAANLGTILDFPLFIPIEYIFSMLESARCPTMMYILMVLFSIFIFCLHIPIIVLYGLLGYTCKKWRTKNNIPLNSVFEKDAIVITIIFLLFNIMWIWRFYF